jgi:hypothetical protein
MKEPLATVTAIIGAACFIAAGAWYVQPDQQPQTLQLAQIVTDRATTSPVAPAPDRTMFVEKPVWR